jgi:hypothetical protein
MRSPDALASGQADDDYEARPASSKSSTASWLFSATAICAPRASRNTSARARANSSGSPSHHSASDAIASSARPGSPWTYSARYSANDAATRACRRASSCCTASGQLEPVGVCVDILRPLRRNPLRLPEVHAAKTAGQETRRGEGAGWGAISSQMILLLFLEIEVHQIGRKATTPTKASKVPRAGRSTRKARDPVVLRSLPPPIPPGREPLEPTALPPGYPQRPPAVKRTRTAVKRWGGPFHLSNRNTLPHSSRADPP